MFNFEESQMSVGCRKMFRCGNEEIRMKRRPHVLGKCFLKHAAHVLEAHHFNHELLEEKIKEQYKAIAIWYYYY